VSFRAVKLVQYTEGLTLAEYGVLIGLASLADTAGWRCCPSLTALAAISNIEKKTAIHAIRRLTAPYIIPDPRPLVSLVDNRKVKVRNHTYELNVPLLRELQEKRRKRVATIRSTTRVGVPTTPSTGRQGCDFKDHVDNAALPTIAFSGGLGVFELPLPGFQHEWVVTREFYDELKLDYPNVNTMGELSRIHIGFSRTATTARRQSFYQGSSGTGSTKRKIGPEGGAMETRSRNAQKAR
jgi:hypothetical protein